MVDLAVHQHPRLQQRDAALLEVVDDRTGDVLALVRVHRHHRRQAPLHRYTHSRAYFSVYYYTKCVLLTADHATLKTKMYNIKLLR